MKNFAKEKFFLNRSACVVLALFQTLSINVANARDSDVHDAAYSSEFANITYSLPPANAESKPEYNQNRRSSSENVDKKAGPANSSDQKNSDIQEDVSFDKNRIPRLKQRVRNLEIAYQTLNAIDTIQTIACTQSKNCQEGNPILGKRPGVSKVLAFKAAAGLIHYTAYRIGLKSEEDLKSTLLMEWITVGVQGFVVGWNFHVIL